MTADAPALFAGATSARQLEALTEGRMPPPDEVAPGVWSVPLPFAGEVVAYGFTYLVEAADGSVHVIDPGWNSEENWRTLVAALEHTGHGLEDVRGMTATHLHPDHLGLAARLHTATGAPLGLLRLEQEALSAGRPSATDVAAIPERWRMPAGRRPEAERVLAAPTALDPITADVLLDDGDLLDVPGRELRVVWTPGHTRGHLCLVSTADGLVFTGDHVLPGVNPGIGLGGSDPRNAIESYLDSLTRIAVFDDLEVCPGHGWRFRGLAERCERIARHHLTRTAEVAALVAERPDASVWEIAAGVSWSAGWAGLHDLTLVSALAQTEAHADLARRHPEIVDRLRS